MNAPESIVIVGASLSGLRAAETLRGEGYGGALTVIGDEPHMPYNRPPLSKSALFGAAAAKDLPLSSGDDLGAEWLLGDAAARLDSVNKSVEMASGATVEYDRLLIATGVRARWPRMLTPGKRVTAVRTIDDAQRLARALESTQRLVVIGAGFIGCEVAAAVRSRGIDVSLVDMAPAPLVGPIGEVAAQRLTGRHAAEGVEMHLGVGVSELVGTPDDPKGVILTDGDQVDADVVVVGIGSQPNVEWLADSGIVLDDGVICDPTLRAEGVDGVWAAGDVVRWRHQRLGGTLTRVEHWTHAAMSGMSAARNMLADDKGTTYEVLPEFWSDQYDMNIRGVGLTGEGFDFQLSHVDEDRNSLVGIYRDGDRVVGALAINATKELARWRREVAATFAA